MRLYARCVPETFAMLGSLKTVEFRQVECIALENTETRETRTFLVKDIRKLSEDDARGVKLTYSSVPWDAGLPVFAIELGEEVIIEPAKCVETAEVCKRDDDEKKYEFFNQRRGL